MLFYRARYYNPTLGSFVSEDPIGFVAGLNLHEYVNDTPSNLRDSYGTDPAIGGTLALILGAGYGALGASNAGGSWQAIVGGTIAGGAAGWLAGGLDPTFGVATVSGDAASFLGDLAGQAVADRFSGQGTSSINWGEAVGAGLGGLVGGAFSGYDGSYDPTNPQSFNRYAYVLNNPLSFTDPTGQDWAGTAIGCAFGPLGCVAGVIADIGFGELISSLFSQPSFHGSVQPRPNAQPWDEYNNYFSHGSIAAALGLPDESCDFGACGGGMGFQQGSTPDSSDHGFLYTAASIAELFRTGFPYDDWTDSNHWLFGTHHCGPGGGGSVGPGSDSLCYAHDTCLDGAHLTWEDETKSLPADKAATMRSCNQTLCDAAGKSSAPSAAIINAFFMCTGTTHVISRIEGRNGNAKTATACISSKSRWRRSFAGRWSTGVWPSFYEPSTLLFSVIDKNSCGLCAGFSGASPEFLEASGIGGSHLSRCFRAVPCSPLLLVDRHLPDIFSDLVRLLLASCS